MPLNEKQGAVNLYLYILRYEPTHLQAYSIASNMQPITGLEITLPIQHPSAAQFQWEQVERGPGGVERVCSAIEH